MSQNGSQFRTFSAANLLGATIAITMLSAGVLAASEANRFYGWGAFGDSFGTPSYTPPKRRRSYVFGPGSFPPLMHGGPRPSIRSIATDRIVFHNSEEPGTILIDTQGRKLYLTLSPKHALIYPISVGRTGFTWTGTEKISRIAEWPDWHPPKEMRERDPRLPKKMLGGIRNPLGAVALFLGNSLYRIHGTNDPKTIGRAASSGCFRMLNGHAVHLASMVAVGTTVKVLPSLAVAGAPFGPPASGTEKIANRSRTLGAGGWATRVYPVSTRRRR